MPSSVDDSSPPFSTSCFRSEKTKPTLSATSAETAAAIQHVARSVLLVSPKYQNRSFHRKHYVKCRWECHSKSSYKRQLTTQQDCKIVFISFSDQHINLLSNGSWLVMMDGKSFTQLPQGIGQTRIDGLVVGKHVRLVSYIQTSCSSLAACGVNMEERQE